MSKKYWDFQFKSTANMRDELLLIKKKLHFESLQETLTTIVMIGISKIHQDNLIEELSQIQKSLEKNKKENGE